MEPVKASNLSNKPLKESAQKPLHWSSGAKIR